MGLHLGLTRTPPARNERRDAMPKILLAEAGAKTRRMLRRFLEDQGLEVCAAASLPEALGLLESVRADALAVGLGAAALRELRAAGADQPALMLLFTGTLEEKRRALEAGADCWLPRPVDPEETALLLLAMTRRRREEQPERRELPGSVWLEGSARELRREGQAIPLPPREYDLLALMLAHPRRIFTRQELLDRLWEMGSEAGPRSVDVAVRRLRARCGESWGFSIQTVRGLGYRLSFAGE